MPDEPERIEGIKYEPNPIRLVRAECSVCDNHWWCRGAIEHEPSYCPYCGVKFSGLTADGDTDWRSLFGGKP